MRQIITDIIIMHIESFVTREQCFFLFLEPMNFCILVVTQKKNGGANDTKGLLEGGGGGWRGKRRGMCPKSS
jgi:hypothetical protein